MQNGGKEENDREMGNYTISYFYISMSFFPSILKIEQRSLICNPRRLSFKTRFQSLLVRILCVFTFIADSKNPE
jgi:hypothetical protein